MKALRYLLVPLLVFLKLGKLGGMFFTMLLSIVLYAQIWGWRYAAGFVALMLIHELGHFVAAKERGLDVGLPTFIPFMGAWVQLKDQVMSVETLAHVALAGPVLGSLASFAVYLLARFEASGWLLALAYSGFFINLFNLVPVPPLDGGKIAAILSPRIWLFGVPLLVGLFLWQPSPVLALIGILAIPYVVRAWHWDPADPRNAFYFTVPRAKRIEYACLYVGLLAFLGVAVYDCYELLSTKAYAA